jgi:hypothetical protein
MFHRAANRPINSAWRKENENMAKFALPGGGVMSNGAYIAPSHKNMARAGAPKKLDPVTPVPGMVRQTRPSAEFLHGAPLMDEPNTVAKLSEGKQVPVHSGMKSAGERGAEANGFDTLRKASDPKCFDNADDQCKALPSAMKE